MRCPECGHALRRALRDYHYTESGLDNVVLEKAPVYVCPDHGVQAVALRNVQGIHGEIAAALIKLARPMRGVEIRFLRKHRGWSQAELACRLGVTEVTVSRWETEAPAIGSANQQRLRLLFADPEAFAALQVTKAQRTGAVPVLRIPVPRLRGWVPSRIPA
jgi:putative zinc finger/helix-turn-helix YgiT family protein